ncbi:MAG: nitrile hydratase accessory protein, partial [Actinomycetota bacterium]
MTTADDVLDVDGPAAPPRANGELVFTAPWQSRLFGATMRLFEAEHFEWDRFRDLLIGAIAVHEQELLDPEQYDYWGCWLRALEQLVTELGLLSTDELERTAAAVAARPPGHDHTHDDHGHDHSHNSAHGH